MKKSTTILLTGLFLSAIATTQCKKKPEENEWIAVQSNKKDTVVNKQPYRYYGGFWYPLYNGFINPTHYNGFTNQEMRSNHSSAIRPSYRSSYSSQSSSSSIKSGGFGSSSRSFSVGG